MHTFECILPRKYRIEKPSEYESVFRNIELKPKKLKGDWTHPILLNVNRSITPQLSMSSIIRKDANFNETGKFFNIRTHYENTRYLINFFMFASAYGNSMLCAQYTHKAVYCFPFFH